MAKRVRGIAGIWLDEAQIVKAASKTKESGFTKFDALTPYPVHGMEEACGIERSNIPYVTFVCGLIGFISAVALEVWTSAFDWALNIGGKPFISGPAFVPIMFELTVLFAAHCSVAAFIIKCRLPDVDPPVIDPALTSHKFGIFIPENDSGYDEVKIEKMFKELGAVEVKKVAEY